MGVAAWLALVVVSGAGCTGSDDGPTADEKAVCASVQDIIDEVVRGAEDPEEDANEPALEALGDLQVAVSATENAVLSEQGAVLFNTITQPVDGGSLTVGETMELGQQIGLESAAALDAIILECERVGAPIEDLDQVPVDEADRQIVGE